MSPRSEAGSIVVIGSINMDLVCRTASLPKAGETALGGDFRTIPGGKGANQAVAAARLADGRASVQMIGRVGNDDFGRQLLAGLKTNAVFCKHVHVTKGVASGVAMILVDDAGENSIVVSPGANALVTPSDIDAAEPLIRGASVVVMQLEIPLKTVRHAIAMCRRHRVFSILDPAPVPTGTLKFPVDLLTPNETEAAMLAGADRNPALTLLARGAKAVILKLGARGCLLATPEGTRRVQGLKVKAVDTTAAGDAFTGALAVARALQMPMKQALQLANAAGALTCRQIGAQPALPMRRDVEDLLHGLQPSRRVRQNAAVRPD